MDLNLSSRIALVCGASQGLGYAVAKEFSREGAIVIICSRNEKKINQAAQKIHEETGNKVYQYRADLAEITEIDLLMDFIKKDVGKIDILINNAGGPPAGYYMDFSEHVWLDVYKLTFQSAIYLTKKILPKMVEQKWGRIINLTSVTVKQPIDNLILSNSIRMAIIGWAKTISNQYAKFGITVNNIATGHTLTERVINLAQATAEQQGITPEEVMAKWKENIPVGRLGKPEEIAWLTIFLASEKASYITGSTISFDGGAVQSM